MEWPKVYLARHGDTEWTVTGQHTGLTDLALTEAGERQARELGERVKGLRVDHVISSPLRRARRTAELAFPNAALELDDALKEWNYGAYEGRRTVDIQAERPGWHLFKHGCPEGETLEEVSARADAVIARLRARGGSTLIFSHRDFLRILAVRWVALKPFDACRLQLATASLSILGYDHDLSEPVIHGWNLPR